MPDLRSFSRPPEVEPTEIHLDREESHHLVTTNRARVGDTVVVFDGRGNEWVCELRTADRTGAVLGVRFRQRLKPLPYRVTLAQALPKGKFMDSIVRMATEVGAATIVPLESERTVVRVDESGSEHKQGKWEQVAVEAAKQCGNPWLPEIRPVQKVEPFVSSGARDHDLRLIASLQPGARSLREVLTQFRADKGRAPTSAVWMIGPEGDFTTAEMSLARNFGFEPVTLGPLVLRCETAAIYALSILSYELQGDH
jgi:16S rRNA (uracil1498-N3)-methyltransferase